MLTNYRDEPAFFNLTMPRPWSAPRADSAYPGLNFPQFGA